MILRVETTNALTGEVIDTTYRIVCKGDCGEQVEADSLELALARAGREQIRVDELTGDAICPGCLAAKRGMEWEARRTA